MANIKISEMTEATSFDDGDYAMIVQANQNKKISKENIFSNLEDEISANTNNITATNDKIGDLSNLETSDKTNVVNAINSRTLRKLWENPNPSNSVSTQNITLSSNDYDYLIFVCRLQPGNDLVSQFTLKGYGANFGIGWDYNGGSGYTYYNAGYRRAFSYSSDTSYRVSDCYVRYSNNTSNTIVNNYIVPLFVYAGKF